MKTITFKNGLAIINEDGKPAVIERVGVSLSAEEVQNLLQKHEMSLDEENGHSTCSYE